MNDLIKWEPHPYQSEAILHVLRGFAREQCSALFLQPGLGKTSVTLQVFKYLKNSGAIRNMLVVAPLRVAQITWPDELEKWQNFFGLSMGVLHGTHKNEILKQKHDIYVINYEGLPWLFAQKWRAPDMLVFDELSRMKSWSSHRVKLMRHFLHLFKFRLGLTGTPASNGLEDIFSQAYMLDLGNRFGSRKTHFMNAYFNPRTNYSFKRAILPGAAAHIHEKLSTLAYSIDGAKHIKLPQEIHNVISLELDDKLRQQYNTLKKEAILQLESMEVITALTAAAASTKLRQLLSGAIYNEYRVPVPVHNLKLDALKEFVEDNAGMNLLVGYMYKHEVERFKQVFPHASFFCDAKNEADTMRLCKRWNAGDIPLLFGHPASISHGLNLQQNCSNIMFYSLDFNLDYYLQFIKRVARQGQKESHVTIHYLLFKDTIDEYVLDTLNGKNVVQNSLLSYLQS
jgi:SNF2 family DNA or RNA helicase